jgi:hypothetical protein
VYARGDAAMTQRGWFAQRLAGVTAVAVLVGLAVASVFDAPLRAASRDAAAAASTDRRQAQAPQGPAKPTQPKKDPLVKAAEPWPEPEQLSERRVAAENLPLFKSSEPLAFTLTADFAAINRDRDPNSSSRFAGVLALPGEGGGARSVPVQLSARGHARRNRQVCAAVPLRLEFVKKDLAGTVFEGQRELKLVTHCENAGEYEQYVLTEYMTYRIFGLLTPISLRTRLAKVTYIDPARNRAPTVRYGILIENDEDLARRMEGRLHPVANRLFSQLNRDSLVLMMLLQFMVGNTDYSIMALHNVKLVRNQGGVVFPVAYDFDYSGLVNARYAVVDPRLHLSSVRDRLYRGPCLTAVELDPLLAMFAARKDAVMAIVDAVPDLTPARRDDAREFLNGFFSLMANPARARRTLVDSCKPFTGM